MSFNFALFVKHPDPEYLVFNADFKNQETNNTGYDSAYLDTLNDLSDELADFILANKSDGIFKLHPDDPTCCVIERNWVSVEAAQEWINVVLRVHQAHDTPLPLEAKVVNLTTLEETVIYPV